MKQDRSPAFYFSAFVLALAAALLAAAVASPWIQDLIRPVRSAQLHRVFSRLAELGLFLGTWWLLRRLDLVDRRLLGYGTSLPLFLKRVALGLLIGLPLMALSLVPLFLLGLRSPAPQAVAFASVLLHQFPAALLTGVSVALLEETFFRGAMQGAMSRRGAFGLALFGVPVVYATVHFLGETVRVPNEQVTWLSGFTVLRSFFGAFSEPAQVWDAFIALYFVGLLLGLVRRRWGDVAVCIGMHAGFVAIIALLRKNSIAHETAPWSFLSGSWDGLLGLWIALVSALGCVIVARLPLRKA